MTRRPAVPHRKTSRLPKWRRNEGGDSNAHA